MTPASTAAPIALRRPRHLGLVNWTGLWTLATREIRGAIKGYHYAILGPIMQNLLYLLVFRMALGDAGARVGNLDFIAFLVPGLVIFAICDRSFGAISEALIYQKHLHIIDDIIMAPLTPAERTTAFVLGSAVIGIAIGIAVALGVAPIVAIQVHSPALMLYFAAGGAIIHALIGLIVGLWATKWDHYAVAHNFLVVPLAFLSGTFYSIDALPELGQRLVELNPIFYVIDGFRAGCTGQAERSIETGMIVVAATVALLAVAAHHLVRSGYKVKP
jgi:ABC-2 type transport system permease protein